MKFSVVDLGETPMSSSNPENKGELRNKVIALTKVLRKYLPSFCGLMLQVCGRFITSEQFKLYKEVTEHERLANILHNVQNLHNKLNLFCDNELMEKPESLESELNYSCLTNKSVLAHKLRSPRQIAEYLVESEVTVVVTSQESKEGIAFDHRGMAKFPWYVDSFNAKKDGVSIFTKMRTRQLIEKKECWAAFLSFEYLKPSLIEKLKTYALGQESFLRDEVFSDKEDEVTSDDAEEVIKDPRVIVAKYQAEECTNNEEVRIERNNQVEEFIMTLELARKDVKNKFQCQFCKLYYSSKRGLRVHINKCKKK